LGFFVAGLICMMANAAAAHESVLPIAPSLSLGVFFEFGDEAGMAGGFDLWAGASVYPGADGQSARTAPFISPGIQLRTGFIPLLTGPTEICPQVRMGLASLAGVGSPNRDTAFDNLFMPDARLYAIAGYRWALAFGWDNMDGRRKNEEAVRLGLGAVFPAIPNGLDIPMVDGADFFVDINRGGEFDRLGFDLVMGI
jgi:hypothetical protein